MSEGVKVEGECVYFNGDKGYGFLKIEGRDVNLFVHANDLKKAGLGPNLPIGSKVTCRVGTTQRSDKECAVDIEKMNGG